MAACSAAVDVPPPEPVPQARAACERLARALPAELVVRTAPQEQREDRRKVRPDETLTAAWGNPPIVLRCGVAQPPLAVSGARPDVSVDGVTWQPLETREGYLFTTIGRVVFVEVNVPRAYAPEVDALVDLAPALKGAVPCAPGPRDPDCSLPPPPG